MYLFVTTTGRQYSRMDYRFAGKRKTLSLGVYPDISLAKARKLTLKTKEDLADGIDPSFKKQVEKAFNQFNSANTFKVIAANGLLAT